MLQPPNIAVKFSPWSKVANRLLQLSFTAQLHKYMGHSMSNQQGI